MIDFEGGKVVNINEGVEGMVEEIVIGKRDGYGKNKMEKKNIVI